MYISAGTLNSIKDPTTTYMSQGPNFDIGTCQKNRVAGFSFFPQYI